MEKVKTVVQEAGSACEQVPAGPCSMTVFGASGDLTRRKLLASLFELYNRALIPDEFYFVGAGRKQLTNGAFRDLAAEAIEQNTSRIHQGRVSEFLGRLYYISGSYDEPSFYSRLSDKLAQLDARYNVQGSRIFYLSVPPFLYAGIVEQLRDAGLSCPGPRGEHKGARMVIEKPFGRDLESAVELNKVIRTCFDESQIYRIDHYLGKETVQNILMFRFANSIFEPVWNREHIDNIQITIAETAGIEHRAGYYDKTGALRDMFQNHMLQMLSLVAMEPPVSFDADHIRDEKYKLYESIRGFDAADIENSFVRGRYGPGKIGEKEVSGYLQEQGVSPDSSTETYVAARVFIDNWRWKDVPFYLRTGKRLSHKDTEIAIQFRKVPYSMFASAGLKDVPANEMVLQIQPDEAISLSFQAKKPGSRLCMGTLNMSFKYKEIFGGAMPEAYQRLLLDCMSGDQTLFDRYDSVIKSWELLMPVIRHWEKGGTVHEYPAGSGSFPAADSLIESDGRCWRNLGTI